jgi:hypothetical protein
VPIDRTSKFVDAELCAARANPTASNFLTGEAKVQVLLELGMRSMAVAMDRWRSCRP